MPSIDLRADIEAPRRAVWRALTDPDHLTDWLPLVDEVERIDGASIDVGTRIVTQGGVGPTSATHEWQVTEFSRLQTLTLERSSPWLHATLSFTLRTGTSGCRLHQNFEFVFLQQYPRIGWWLEVVFLRQFVHLVVGLLVRSQLRESVRSIARLAERETPDGAET